MANYGQPPYGAPGYGAPPGGQPGYGAPNQYGAPGQAPYGAPPQGGYPGAPAPQAGYPGQPGYGAPPASGGWAAPTIDPTIQQWFMAVDTDRSGHISATELRQALVNGNWSHFNPEACRLMIGMFDRDNSGTIQLHEFQSLWNYIQQWKGVFERFDTNRSGSIEAHEFGQAISSMGYNLSPRFHQMCICKFDVQGRRCMKLDDFIQSCVMIKSLTDMFQYRDTQRTGTINVNYEDFMTMAVSYKA